MVKAGQILFFSTVLVYMAFLSRDFRHFLLRPFIEDAFYMLSVARSLANGTGWSVDGVHRTNGVQPLIALIDAPAFVVGGGNALTSLRLVLQIQILFFALLAHQLGSLVERLAGGGRPDIRWSVAALTLCNYTLSAVFLNGLETGLAVWLVLLSLTTLDTIMSTPRTSRRMHLLLGAQLGAAVLARIDAVALVCVCVGMLAIRATNVPRGNHGSGVTRDRLIGLSIMTSISLAITLPWWLFNIELTGSLMPTSGQAVQLSTFQHPLMSISSLNVLLNQLFLFLHAPYDAQSLSIVGAMAVVPFLIAILMLRRRVGTSAHAGSTGRRVLPAAMFSVALIGLYTFGHQAPHFQARYLAFPRLFVMIAAAWVLVASLLPSRLGKRTLLAIAALWVLASLGLSVRNITGERGNEMVAVADWIREHTGPEDRIGMFQSGTTGFLFPDRVVNLDGKVNIEAMRAYREGRLRDYVDRAALDYIIDWPEYVSIVAPQGHPLDDYENLGSIGGHSEVWRRRVP